MTSPLAYLEWLTLQQAAEAIAETPAEVDGWRTWISERCERDEVTWRHNTLSLTAAEWQVDIERKSLIACCRANGIPLRRLDPRWTDAPATPAIASAPKRKRQPKKQPQREAALRELLRDLDRRELKKSWTPARFKDELHSRYSDLFPDDMKPGTWKRFWRTQQIFKFPSKGA